MGLGRWLYYRGRDLVLFGPQLVIHALGQVVRQSLEFVLSGALANDAKAVNIPFRAWVGPREDRPFERYQSIVNLRTVVWGVGLFSLMLNLFALANLDFLNVLLLLPSLMFSVSTLVGPFLLQPKPGKHIGPAVWRPKVAGWFVSFGFYMLVARLISYGGRLQWVGVFLCVGLFSRVLLVGLKYVGYPSRLRKLIRLLARQIAEGGLAADEAQKLAQTVIRDLDGDLDKTKAALQKTSLPAERQKLVLETFEAQVVPLLRRPVTDIQTQDSARRRFISEWNRSFVLGLFTFLWFFVVPLPGLLVFTAPGGYRVSMSLAGILDLAVTAVGVVLASGVVSLLLEQRELFGLRGDGLLTSVKRQYESFLLKAARLSPVQMSRFYAMFTEIQTHFDQRSYAFAWRTLRLIETDLKEAEKSD
jgi:hypothetical protein